MAKQFYYRQMGEVFGPFTGQELKQFADSGTIDRGTDVSADRERWVLADQVQGLFPPTPASVPDVPPLDTRTLEGDGRWALSPDTSPLPFLSTPRPPHRPRAVRVSRGLLPRLIEMLDMRFERYLTPQLIRLFWVLSIVLAVVVLCSYGVGALPYSLPHRKQVENEVPYETLQRKTMIAGIIDERERQQAARTATESPAAIEFSQPDFPATQTAAADPLAEYRALTSKTTEQLKAELAKLEEQFPPYRPEWVVRNSVVYVLSGVAMLLTAVLTLLVVRIACEMLVVIFNIANHLQAIRELAARQVAAPASD